MTAAFLQSELSSLFSDSKRKNNDVRQAAERSLSDLKTIAVTSEAQLAGDLVRRPQFIEPFVLACRSQNSKLAGTGAACIQRLVASTAIPRSRLPDILQSFEEAISLGLDVQLKVLQTLPSLLQLYAAELHGEALAKTLSVCADLSSSKQPVVCSTASATFQQLVSTVFTHANLDKKPQRPASQDVISDGASDDALAIFVDLCGLLTGVTATFVRLDNLPPPLILETLEALLSSHGDMILTDEDALVACRSNLVPGLDTLVESSNNYGIVVRSIRITFILVTRHLRPLQATASHLLAVLLKIIDHPGVQKWKRVLGLEFLRGLFSDSASLRDIFAALSQDKEQETYITRFMASLVRIAAEDPALIGLGRQSSLPSSAAIENATGATDPTDLPIAQVVSSDIVSIGISKDRSTTNTPCLDQFDRQTPPEVPDTYTFALVLGCISAFSDGLSKHIMPLSVPTKRPVRPDSGDQPPSDSDQIPRRSSTIRDGSSEKYQHLINPLSRHDLSERAAVQTSVAMIEACWPAVLAICSTFLNAALDSYFYHILIRTVQKLAQVSGVLELDTPRDALLTTLAKASVPANITGLLNSAFEDKPALLQRSTSDLTSSDQPIQSPKVANSRPSLDSTLRTFNLRNLLCLRALLNLGIALGPTLSHAAWKIILQSLQQVEALISVSDSTSTMASEIAAVDTARRRLVDGTVSFTGPAFVKLCDSLFEMVEQILPSETQCSDIQGQQNGHLKPRLNNHKSARSVSGSWAKPTVLEVEVQFVLATVGRLASVNLARFRQTDKAQESWQLIINKLLLLVRHEALISRVRIQAGNIIDAVVVEICSAKKGVQEAFAESDELQVLLKHGLPALRAQSHLLKAHPENTQSRTKCNHDIVAAMLEALANVVGAQGENLNHGWTQVFDILEYVLSTWPSDTTDAQQSPTQPLVFKILQLIVSDFLVAVEESSLNAILRLSTIFGSQQYDLNMSLTAISLFWNVASLLSEREKEVPSFNNLSPELIAESGVQSNHESLDTWQNLFLSLSKLCLDDRTDVRTAATRMFAKTVDSGTDFMSSEVMNSLLGGLTTNLLRATAKKCSNDVSWYPSVVSILDSLTSLIQKHSSLSLNHQTFEDTWTHFLAVSEKVIEIRDMTVAQALLRSVAEIIRSIVNVPECLHRENRNMISATWNLWLSSSEPLLAFDEANQSLISAHFILWSQLSEWNRDIVSTEDAVKMTLDTVEKLLYATRHEQYTLDVRTLAPEQLQALEIFKTLGGITHDQPAALIIFLLKLNSTIINRNQITDRSLPSKRRPTGVAFATECVRYIQLILDTHSDQPQILSKLPIVGILECSANLATQKYSSLPTNIDKPLWREGTILGVHCSELIDRHLQDFVPQAAACGPVLNLLMQSILGANFLETIPSAEHPALAQILSDESFDIDQGRSLFRSLSIFRTDLVSEAAKQELVSTIFRYSLIAPPLHGDFQPKSGQPLENFVNIRRGSVKEPSLPPRSKLYGMSLECLFDLTSRDKPCKDTHKKQIAEVAAPWVILRVGHVLKTFIADQPLRYLEPPPLSRQEELALVLQCFVDLRVSDVSFSSTAQALGVVPEGFKGEPEDGLSHLRILWELLLRFDEIWYQMPRLKQGHAWQDQEHGKVIESCLKEWKRLVIAPGSLHYK